jgi:16S rRNA (cytosine1402-N4)-methyltransferase
LRIEVNSELTVLAEALPAALDALAPGGRIAVLSYHSLEDRLVKRAFAERARSRAPIDLPVEPAGFEPTLRLLTRGAEAPGPAEVAANPRAASARLRAAERIPPPGRPPRQIKGMHQPATRPATGRHRRHRETEESTDHITTEGVNSNDEV